MPAAFRPVSRPPASRPPASRPAASRSATLSGLAAIALWGSLAVLSAAAGPAPPFQMTAFAFLLAGLVGLGLAGLRGRLGLVRPTRGSLLLGLYGLFGYHALYFAALKLSPPAEANLVNSLWALLIVLFAGLLPGGRIEARHAIGAGLGLLAVVLLVGERLGAGGDAGPRALAGYGLAFGCALVWSSYSVGSKLVASVPTESLSIACLATSGLALACHLAFEATVWPAGRGEWLALIALGLGPAGLAFFLWDAGMKRGDVPLLGALAYASPILSTLLLVAAGFTRPTWTLAAACGLILLGALVATRRGDGAR